ncbi:MAG: adenosylcobinamide-phosphate synthase CbiB [Vicinamibacterales bacterium]
MADWLTAALSSLAPDPGVLVLAVALDLAVGDPVYAWHPVRIIGHTLAWMENALRRAGLDGYAGGVLLGVGLATVFLLVTGSLLVLAGLVAPVAERLVHLFIVYSLLALGDLFHHVWRIESAVQRGDLVAARTAVSALVGRDTDRLDGAACRRAAVESLSENLTDGFVSAVLWYVVLGLPGLVLFKVVSTMDSMVGYKTPRYLRFGWCGARLDDVMNYVPARLTWVLIAVVAGVFPNYSGRKAWAVGLSQHALLLGPNSGWSEAATAGALERRLVGPVWRDGVLVTDLWIGDPADAPLGTRGDVIRAVALAMVVGLVTTAAGYAYLATR